MKRAAALIALFASACTTMEPAYVRPSPAIPSSWPVGDPYLRAAEAPLPAVRYTDVFRDPARVVAMVTAEVWEASRTARTDRTDRSQAGQQTPRPASVEPTEGADQA